MRTISAELWVPVEGRWPMADGAVHRHAVYVQRALGVSLASLATCWHQNKRAGSRPPHVGDYREWGSLDRETEHKELQRNWNENWQLGKESEENERNVETRKEIQVQAGSEQRKHPGGSVLPAPSLDYPSSSVPPPFPPQELLYLFFIILAFPLNYGLMFYFYLHISSS